MKTKTKTKTKVINAIPNIGVVAVDELLFKPLQSGTFEGCHFDWAIESFKQLLEQLPSLPSPKEIHDFFYKHSCRVSPFNVPRYISNGQR